MTKQRYTIAFISLLTCLCLHATCYSQELQNPSFEGVGGVARTPEGWKAFGTASSPDTQPGAWKVATPPSHGNSYISMVCRGYSIFDSYLWESCIQSLNNPLTIGETYHYSIDLAHSSTFLADTILFNQPVNLRVWGMSENLDNELLWESGAISNTDWKTFYFEVKPNIETDYLLLESYYVELPKYCGNILIDNMQYYPNGHPELDQESPKDTVPVIVETDYDVTPDFDVILDKLGLPDSIDSRAVKEDGGFTFRGDQLKITVWDNRTTDGDVISLFLNEKNILKEFEISKERLKVTVDVEEGKEYFLTLYAHNLGEIPPNTVALYISDGQRKKFITLSSDLDQCGAVKIKIDPALVGDK